MLLAIDPGKDTGWAYISPLGLIVDCGVTSANDLNLTRKCTAIVIEKPQIYAQRLMKGDPNDLITLAISLGRISERLRTLCDVQTLVTPAEWKGQIPKEIHHERIKAELSDHEMKLIEVKSKDIARTKKHNMWDAIGLARWGMKKGLWIK